MIFAYYDILLFEAVSNIFTEVKRNVLSGQAFFRTGSK